jgi:methyl-accepting chemotaxis protein
MGTLNQKTDTLYDGSTRPIADIADARAAYTLNRVFSLRYQYVTAPADRPDMRKQIAANDRDVDVALNKVAPTLSTAAGRQALATARAQLKDYRTFRTVSLDNADRGEPSTKAQSAKISAAGDAAVAALVKITKIKTDLATEQRREAQDAYHGARTKTIILLVLAILAGAIMSVLIVRSIRRTTTAVVARLRSLRERDTAALRDGLQHMADGDLTVTAAVVTEPIERLPADELGDIAREVNAVREDTAASVEAYNASRAALGGLVSDVADATRSVSLASQQMASTSNEAGRAVGEIANAMTDVVEGAERQVGAVRHTQERVEAMAATSASSATEVEETATAATQAREVAGRGAEAVASATEA